MCAGQKWIDAERLNQSLLQLLNLPLGALLELHTSVCIMWGLAFCSLWDVDESLQVIAVNIANSLLASKVTMSSFVFLAKVFAACFVQRCVDTKEEPVIKITSEDIRVMEQGLNTILKNKLPKSSSQEVRFASEQHGTIAQLPSCDVAAITATAIATCRGLR